MLLGRWQCEGIKSDHASSDLCAPERGVAHLLHVWVHHVTLEEALGCSLVADGGVGPETMGQLFPVIALQTGHKGVVKATLQCSCDLCDTLRVGRWEE